jgi:hypothetical protein
VLYQRLPRLLTELALPRGDGCHQRMLHGLGRVKFMVLDLCAERGDVELTADSVADAPASYNPFSQSRC